MSAAEKLEPEAKLVADKLVEVVKAGAMISEADTIAAPMLSIAISLKRIADAMSGSGGSLDKLVAALDPENPEGFLRAPINCYGEGIGEAIQGQLVRGQRGIDQYEGR